MTVYDVMQMMLNVPIEKHETTQVLVAIYDPETGEPWTAEQHDALNAEFELLIRDDTTEE